MTDSREDPCLAVVRAAPALDPAQIVEFLVKFSGLSRATPRDRICAAVSEELVDLCQRTHAEVLETDDAERAGSQACEALGAALALAREDPAATAFPRTELAAEAEQARRLGAVRLAACMDHAVARHEAFEARVRWLVGGTTREQLETLDPLAERDRIHHALSSTFRSEARVLELLSINRVAVAGPLAGFVRSTREAESNGVARFYDTFTLFANYFEWGRDSKRGRAAIRRMNEIHGRYTIPNEGMKYVLLQMAFTWLDGADRIAHRPILTVERRGFFHAVVEMGRDMHIEDIDHDYDAMVAWFRAFNRAHAEFAPFKRDFFETIVDRSVPTDVPAVLRRALHAAARVAMDEDYRSALGYEDPSPADGSSVRSVFSALGTAASALPYTPFLRSLQNNPARRGDQRPERLGVNERSAHLPVVRRDRPNGGFPLGQRPVRTLEDAARVDVPEFEWDEIQRHATAESLWIVIDGDVYDLTAWVASHPGGRDVLLQWGGKDATAAFRGAPHSEQTAILKLNFRVGTVREPGPASPDAGDP